MLITKFRNKYANDDSISIKGFIDNEVQRFLNSNRLTETNLKSLDEKIQLERYAREKKRAIIKDRQANDDTKSRTSKVKSQRPQTAYSRAPSSKAPS
jgi:phosphomevalonate kinase